ncbi:hypothetical protein AB0L67_41600 [Streptomyces flaveolus]|uniref:hypothetical protein n=1 Tax=Streptomyces flaveolus TaxID=67297 RepID=UPI003438367F
MTDVLNAFLQTPPELTQPVVRKHQFPLAVRPTAPAPAPDAKRPEGLGPLTAWYTEAVLPVGSTSCPRPVVRCAPTWCSPRPATMCR